MPISSEIAVTRRVLIIVSVALFGIFGTFYVHEYSTDSTVDHETDLNAVVSDQDGSFAMDGFPNTFPIKHDDYHANHIGLLKDGRQFFLTEPFVPAFGEEPGCEFIALFIFDNDGTLLGAQIDNLGPRGTFDTDSARNLYQERLASLGDIDFRDIRIAPFTTKKFGITFGFIPNEIEDEEDVAYIEFHPGNYMAFYEPWNGEYDT